MQQQVANFKAFGSMIYALVFQLRRSLLCILRKQYNLSFVNLYYQSKPSILNILQDRVLKGINFRANNAKRFLMQ